MDPRADSDRTRPSPSALVRAMRPRHWVKNVLVFAAPLAAGRLFDLEVFIQASGAFVAFCLAASAVYLVNDVRDVEEDRAHPTKRFRPIAAGELGATTALLAATVIGVAALIVAAVIELGLLLVITAYLALSVLYSVALKDEPTFDLAIVAAGFLLRAMSGGVAAGIPLSQWFLLTAAFGSLFMVTGKRFSEIELVGEGNAETRRSLDRYSLGYLRSVWTLAATMTVATYSLWAFEMTETFQRPVLAQLSIAPFALGMLRHMATIDHGNAVDPVETVLRDRGLHVLGLIWLALFVIGVTGV